MLAMPRRVQYSVRLIERYETTALSLRQRAIVSVMSRAGGYVYNITCAIKIRNNNAASGLLAGELGPAGFRGPRRRIASSESHLIFSGRASRNDAYRQPGARPPRRPTAYPVHRHVRPHRAKCWPKLGDRQTETRPPTSERVADVAAASTVHPSAVPSEYSGEQHDRRLFTERQQSPKSQPSSRERGGGRESCLSVQNDSDSVNPKHHHHRQRQQLAQYGRKSV